MPPHFWWAARDKEPIMIHRDDVAQTMQKARAEQWTARIKATVGWLLCPVGVAFVGATFFWPSVIRARRRRRGVAASRGGDDGVAELWERPPRRVAPPRRRPPPDQPELRPAYVTEKRALVRSLAARQMVGFVRRPPAALITARRRNEKVAGTGERDDNT